MHRVHSILLNLQTLAADGTEKSLREHFTREQNVTLGRLTEWKQRRPEIYRQANDDFQSQVKRKEPA